MLSLINNNNNNAFANKVLIPDDTEVFNFDGRLLTYFLILLFVILESYLRTHRPISLNLYFTSG